MRFRSINTWSDLLAMLTVGCWTTESNAAEEPGKEQQVNDSNPFGTQNQARQTYQKIQQAKDQVKLKEMALLNVVALAGLSSKIRVAAEAVRDAKGDEAKAAAQKDLSELLGKYFEEDMKRRQQELTQIEERVTKLRELLERRRGKKQEILELQMRVALNEADGLGFYDNEQLERAKAGNLFFKIDPFGGVANPPSSPTKIGPPIPTNAPEPKR